MKFWLVGLLLLLVLAQGVGLGLLIASVYGVNFL